MIACTEKPGQISIRCALKIVPQGLRVMIIPDFPIGFL